MLLVLLMTCGRSLSFCIHCCSGFRIISFAAVYVLRPRRSRFQQFFFEDEPLGVFDWKTDNAFLLINPCVIVERAVFFLSQKLYLFKRVIVLQIRRFVLSQLLVALGREL